jgi:hypothetical protein
LSQIIAQQKEIVQLLGPQNPIVDLQKVVNALQLAAEAAGIANPQMFFGDPVNPDGSPYVPQPLPPQPAPDTVLNTQTLAQIEQMKTRSSQTEKAAELQSKQAIEAAKISADKEVALARLAVEREIELLKIGADQQKIQVEAAKAALDAQAKQDALAAKVEISDKKAS